MEVIALIIDVVIAQGHRLERSRQVLRRLEVHLDLSDVPHAGWSAPLILVKS